MIHLVIFNVTIEQVAVGCPYREAQVDSLELLGISIEAVTIINIINDEGEHLFIVDFAFFQGSYHPLVVIDEMGFWVDFCFMVGLIFYHKAVIANLTECVSVVVGDGTVIVQCNRRSIPSFQPAAASFRFREPYARSGSRKRWP